MKLYLRNLDDDIDDERLRKEFSQYGNITSAEVIREEGGGASTGYGIVSFSAPEEATKAATEMDGCIISKPLQVTLDQRKRVNDMNFAVQHMQEMSGIHINPSASYPMVPFGRYS
ncbi:PABPC4 [Bugula neritina]|uniref:PABPC4 n=1 Tax=Bugula neritina TaxID=10212 RepID=A0A7J7J4U9_BUGNE|nr:PABPC4 [Bugula neritina]